VLVRLGSYINSEIITKFQLDLDIGIKKNIVKSISNDLLSLTYKCIQNIICKLLTSRNLLGITEQIDPRGSLQCLQFHRDDGMAEQRNESVIFKFWFADCYVDDICNQI